MNRFDDDIIYESDSEQFDGDKPRKRLGGNIIARIVCLLIAFLIWLYVMYVDSPDHEEVYRSISVTLENASVLKNEYNMSVISGAGNLADVTIKGKKSELGRYSKKDIKVYVDLSHISDTGKHVLDVMVETPDGLVVSDVSPSSIQVYVDNNTAKPIKVVAKAVSYTLDASYELGELMPDVTEVMISGPAKTLEQIDHALVELQLGTLSETMLSRGALKLVNADGDEINDPYVKMNTSSVQVKVPVYTYKEVPLAVEYRYGYLNEKNSETSVSPSSITLKGDPKVLDTIESIPIVTIDEKKLNGDYNKEHLIPIPAETTLMGTEESATVTVKHKDTEKRTFTVTEFEVINPKGLEYDITDSLNIVLRGTPSLLSIIAPQYITVTVDLTHIGTNTGIMSLPVMIELNSVIKDKVYEIGDYRVQLEIFER